MSVPIPILAHPDHKTYPVDEGPVPSLSEERKLVQHSAQEPILEDKRVGRSNQLLVPKQLELATAPCRLLDGAQRGRRALAPAVGGKPPRGYIVAFLEMLLLEVLLASPTGATLGEVVIFVAVEVGAAEEQRHDHQGFEECAHRHLDCVGVLRL